MALITTIVLSAVCAMGQTARGQKSFGPKAGFVSRNTSALAGLVFEYSFSSHVRIAPQAAVIFRHRDLDGLAVDVDMHFPFAFASGRMAFYPLAGLNFTSWGRHYAGEGEDGKDVTSHTNVFGLNVGAGLELYCTRTLKLSIEGRHTVMKHYPTAFVNAGIAFVF